MKIYKQDNLKKGKSVDETLALLKMESMMSMEYGFIGKGIKKGRKIFRPYFLWWIVFKSL